MGNLKSMAVLMLLSNILIGTPLKSFAEVDESLLQRMFHLIRPTGKYEGRISDVVVKATQKSGTMGMLPRVLLVNHANGETIEWVRGRGSVDPVVCPDGRTLMVRRGTRIERTELTFTGGRLTEPGEGLPVTQAAIRQLYGCTESIDGGGSWDVWIENVEGEFMTIHLEKDRLSLSPLPEKFQSDSPGDSSLALRRLQGIRSDGLTVMVLGGKLTVEQQVDNHLIVSPMPLNMPVTGAPVWLGDTDWIVVTGLKN